MFLFYIQNKIYFSLSSSTNKMLKTYTEVTLCLEKFLFLLCLIFLILYLLLYPLVYLILNCSWNNTLYKWYTNIQKLCFDVKTLFLFVYSSLVKHMFIFNRGYVTSDKVYWKIIYIGTFVLIKSIWYFINFWVSMECGCRKLLVSTRKSCFRSKMILRLNL